VFEKSAVGQPTSNEKRFDDLFQSHHTAIYRYCVRRLGSSDADDAAADVFAVVWRRLDEMPSGDASKAWLFGVANRVVGNKYRSRRRQRMLSIRLQALHGGERPHSQFGPTPSREVQLLLEALEGLSSTDRELLRLSSWDGLTRSEIAQVLGINDNAVDQRLRRARSRLKVRFDRLNNAPTQAEPEEASA
jgi:RNA polymerase sigma-70 factor (ECF subfamily)